MYVYGTENETKDWTTLLLLIFKIHWYSILNSTMLIVLLVGIVAIILTRSLNRDIQKHKKSADGVVVLNFVLRFFNSYFLISELFN